MIIVGMLTTPPSRWAVQGASFALWALAAASAVAWGFKLSAPASSASAVQAGGRGAVVPDPAAIARLLGASPLPAAGAAPQVNVASRFNLVGVVSRPSRTGIALISVDGKPAKPFRVGSSIDEGFVLQSVEGRRANIGPTPQGPAALTLELPQVRR